MNLTLTRQRFRADGIFGVLASDDGKLKWETLEHAYPVLGSTSVFAPKVPEGAFLCVLGLHNLDLRVERGLPPFLTFEITGVAGHKDILFHRGNFNADSNGCVLLGKMMGEHEVICSEQAFNEFMEAQKGVSQFTLTVVNAPV
jgi:hypothetical protein